MKHIIVTRCKFDTDEKFNRYFGQIKNFYIPSINSQVNKNFEIALIANDNHFNLIRNMIDDKIIMRKFTDVKSDYKEYVVENNYTIQTRHDCDDIMNSDYVDYIQKLYTENEKKYDKFILNFHPNKFVASTKQEYKHTRDYSKVCSMFSTLIQKKVDNGIMDVMHDHLSRITRNIIYINKPYVKLVIHDNNLLSRV
jgi:hypothetical protein